MSKFRLVAPFMIVMLVLTACPAGDDGGGGGDGGGGSPGEGDGGGEGIVVTSLWGGEEGAAFEEVLAAFTEETGIEAQFDSQRTDYAGQLRTRIEGGNPPDVAIIPGIGYLRGLVRDEYVIPLSELGINREDIEGNYAPGVLDIGTVNDELYAVMVKTNSKSAVWYQPSYFEEAGLTVPETYDEMLTVSEEILASGKTPWALGAAAPDSDWTLTDWFESVYIRQAGLDNYDALFSGELAWTDQSVIDAVDTMKQILNDEFVTGGIEGAMGTDWISAIGSLYSTDDAELYHANAAAGGIAINQVNTDLQEQIGTEIDYFPFPTINDSDPGIVTIGGDVIAALTDNPGVAEFMEFMTGTTAGETWVETGFIVSPVTGVSAESYPNELAAKEAQQIAEATEVRFDGSDLLPGGPSLGGLLQSALRGEEVEPLLEQFETEIQAAWEADRGG